MRVVICRNTKCRKRIPGSRTIASAWFAIRAKFPRNGTTNVRDNSGPMVNLASHIRTAGLVCLAAVLLGISSAAGGPAPTSPKKAASPKQKSEEVFKNLKVLRNTPSEPLVSSMQFMTSSLGVHCEYCHVENAFERDDKKSKQTARQMMRMVARINATEFHGKQEITCYSCHRGSPKPLTVPVIAKVSRRLLSAPTSGLPQPPDQLSPADVIKKYIQARGGTDAIANLKSLQEKGAFRSDSSEFPLELYATNAARSATVIHFPGADRIETLDGTSGWISLPGATPRPMTSARADAARIDDDLQFALDPNRIFPEIKGTGISKVGTEDAVMLSGGRPGFPPVEMYFSVSSGLLLRIVHYSPSALGLNPTQTDYSDYREIGGVKIPFHWTSSTPEGSFSVQIESAEANEQIPEKEFAMPPGQ